MTVGKVAPWWQWALFGVAGFAAFRIAVKISDAGVAKSKRARPNGSKRKRRSRKLMKACWPGYEAYGTKLKRGRRVPNCVPK